MGLTRVELAGRVVKPPMLAVTPRGRAVLRLCVDCGEEPEHLLLEVVFVNKAANELARLLTTGHRIHALGSLTAIGKGAGRQQIEVMATEVALDQPRTGSGNKSGFTGRAF